MTNLQFDHVVYVLMVTRRAALIASAMLFLLLSASGVAGYMYADMTHRHTVEVQQITEVQAGIIEDVDGLRRAQDRLERENTSLANAIRGRR